MSGLSINESEFKELPATQQRLLLFKNSKQSIEMLSIYRIRQKVQYYWLAALTAALAFLTKLFISKSQ